jgi:hypothetical protein
MKPLDVVYETRKLLSIDANEYFTDEDLRIMIDQNLTVENIEYNYSVIVDWMVERAK